MEQESTPAHVDCPTCPKCGFRDGVPARKAHYAIDEGNTLWCPACGYSWAGSVQEVEQAERAEVAWESIQQRWREVTP